VLGSEPLQHGQACCHVPGTGISGLAADSSGLVAVRPGTAGDGVAYFSPNGRSWQYSATLGAAGGFIPQVVKGSAHGFVVADTDGRTWSTIVLPLPYGATGVLQQVAIHDNRVVALGMQTSGGVTTPLAELSTDGGATWRQVPFGAPSGSAGIPSCQGVAAKCSASSAATWSAACSGSQCEAPSSSVKR